jgi:transaldolase
VQNAADLFRPTFDRSQRRHGFVSLEVSPHLAHDADGTIAEARRHWRTVDRPNLLVKVPGTREGLPAIRQLIREGINVNVTLLFGLPRYREVAEAYISGLEDRADDGQSVEGVASVASFFLSRIDVLVDPLLEEKMNAGGEVAKIATQLHGQTAVASAKLAYQIYKEVFAEDRFAKLAAQGARPQRVLWASTSTKNPQYSDVKYVEALIGPETVNTVPPQTLDAYRDHGRPAARLEDGLKDAEEVFLFLPEVGIDIDQVTQQLEDEGVEKFNQPFDKLLDALKQKSADILRGSGNEPQP